MTLLTWFSTGHVTLSTLYALLFYGITTTLAASPSGVTTIGNGNVQTLTPALVEYIQNQIDTRVLPGVAVAVVHGDGSLEYGSWGVRTEDGVNMTTNVNIGAIQIDVSSGDLDEANYFLDIGRPRLALQSFYRLFHEYSHRVSPSDFCSSCNFTLNCASQ